MKSYNHLYENCISEENRRISLNLAKHSKRMRRIMKSRHLSDDALVALSYDWINNYDNAEHVPVYIYDGITRKERVIIVPTMEELIVQHIVMPVYREEAPTKGNGSLRNGFEPMRRTASMF